MKVLAVILSIATLVLSSYPCCGDIGSCSETQLVGQYDHDDSEEIPHGKETPCSPFYTCGRCPGFTIAYGTLDFIYFEPEKANPMVTYVEALPKEVFFLSLKPPRLFEV